MERYFFQFETEDLVAFYFIYHPNVHVYLQCFEMCLKIFENILVYMQMDGMD